MPLSPRSARGAVPVSGALLALLGLSLLLMVACRSQAGGRGGEPSAVAALVASPSSAAPTSTPSPSTPAPAVPITSPIALPILMYHHVTSAPPADELEFGLTVTTTNFAQQLDYLKCAGYSTITLAELFDYLYRGAALPPKPIVLTFDDGYADAFSDAFPLLKQHGFRATFAVVTGFVVGGPYLTWDQIQTMAAGGMEFAAHTVNHIDLNTSPDETGRDEIAESKRALEEHLGRPVAFFVYPSGEPFRSGSEERQQAVVAMLREAGYSGALLAGPSSTTQDPQRPYELNRVRVSGGQDLYGFAAGIGGPLPDAVTCP